MPAKAGASCSPAPRGQRGWGARAVLAQLRAMVPSTQRSGQRGRGKRPHTCFRAGGSPHLPASRSPHPASRPPAASTVLGPILHTTVRKPKSAKTRRQSFLQATFPGPVTGRRAGTAGATRCRASSGRGEEHRGRGSPGKVTGPSRWLVTTARGSLPCEMPPGRASPPGPLLWSDPTCPPSHLPSPPHPCVGGTRSFSSSSLQNPEGPGASGEGPPTASSLLCLETDGATETRGEMPAHG